ncbi:MAG: hypothetical protein ACM339_04100 [Ignavibacteria bacterium]
MKRKIRSGKQLITIILFFYFVLSSTFVSKIYAQSEAVINFDNVHQIIRGSGSAKT